MSAELVEGVEQLRRMVDATATDVAHVIDVSNPFRSQGYRNARTLLEQRAQLSGPEAHRRIQTARMREQLPEWAGTARNGTVGVAQSESMARVAANPRIDPDELLRDAGLLLDDAIDLPYEEFERNLRRWGGARRPRRRLEPHRFAPRTRRRELAGIFAWYVDAEWRIDWADARNRLGDLATQADLVRTEAQRRAEPTP